MFDGADPRMVKRFLSYHEQNPQVWERFQEMAASLRSSGRRKYSAWVMIQVIRWEHDIVTKGDVFKINNDFIALYARMLIARRPEFEGFFELREMKSTRLLSYEENSRRGIA